MGKPLVEPCSCKDAEDWLMCDTANEFSGVGLICRVCGREFDVKDITEVEQVERPASRFFP